MGGEDKDRETSTRRDDDAGGAGDGEDRREGRERGRRDRSPKKESR